MRILLLIMLFIFYFQHSVSAAAPQLMQRQQKMQQAMMEKAMAEQQLAQAQQAAGQEITINQNIPVSATIEIPAQDQGGGEVVEMADILKSLETSSKAWPLIVDRQPKGFIIYKYIEYFKKKGIIIKKPVEEYIPLIDSMIAENPKIVKNPFKNVFQLVAILEYDFDNRQNKDQMIKELIGTDGYLKNKQRLGLP